MFDIANFIAGQSSGTSDLTYPQKWLAGWSAGGRTSSGEAVTESTVSGLSAYYRSLANLAEDVARTHLNVYEDNGNGVKVRSTEHELYERLRYAPNPEMHSQAFWESIVWNAGGWGRGLAEIERRADGAPAALWPIHPARAELMRDANGGLFWRIYVGDRGNVVNGQSVQAVDIPNRNMFHVYGVGNDGLNAISILRAGAESFGMSIAAQKYGAAYFRKAISPSAVLTIPNRLNSDVAYNNLRASWRALHGGPDAEEGLAILENGSEIKPWTIPPEEAQFLQTRQFQIGEISRWFRMPPHKIMDLGRATWANIEQQDLNYVGDTLGPWYRRIELECMRKLLMESEREEYFVEFDPKSLLRMEAKTRIDLYAKQLASGGMSPNDIRRAENLPPSTDQGSDDLYIPTNLVPLRLAGQKPAGGFGKPKPEGGDTPPPKPAPEPPEDSASALLYTFVDAQRSVVAHAARRCLHKETLARTRAQTRDGKETDKYFLWAREFYSDLAEDFAEATAPALKALAKLQGVAFSDGAHLSACHAISVRYHLAALNESDELMGKPQTAEEIAVELIGNLRKDK